MCTNEGTKYRLSQFWSKKCNPVTVPLYNLLQPLYWVPNPLTPRFKPFLLDLQFLFLFSLLPTTFLLGSHAFSSGFLPNFLLVSHSHFSAVPTLIILGFQPLSPYAHTHFTSEFLPIFPWVSAPLSRLPTLFSPSLPTSRHKLPDRAQVKWIWKKSGNNKKCYSDSGCATSLLNSPTFFSHCTLFPSGSKSSTKTLSVWSTVSFWQFTVRVGAVLPLKSVHPLDFILNFNQLDVQGQCLKSVPHICKR